MDHRPKFSLAILTLCLWDQSDNEKEEDQEKEEEEEGNDSTTSESETEGADLSHVTTSSDIEEDEVAPVFLKCKPSIKRKVCTCGQVDKDSENDEEGEVDEIVEEEITKKKEEKMNSGVTREKNNRQQTDLTGEEVDELTKQVEDLKEQLAAMTAKERKLYRSLSDHEQVRDKLQRLQSQNSVLKEKSSDVRGENDRLVAKIQKLQSRISQEKQVRVSVSEFEEGDPDDIFTFNTSSPQSRGRSPESRIKVSICEEYILDDEKRFEEAAEKIMRLEQRVICLQNANNVNSCATCTPLRAHLLKVERQLLSVTQERRGQLEELYELKQEALSSAVSEKDAHLQWLQVAGEGSSNAHTRGTIERLRKERREILNRMKEENENRMALLSALDDSQALFTGPGKMSTLGSLMRSESLLDPDSSGVQSTSSYQSASTVEEGDLGTRCIFPIVTEPREARDDDDDDRISSKSY